MSEQPSEQDPPQDARPEDVPDHDSGEGQADDPDPAFDDTDDDSAETPEPGEPDEPAE